MDQRLEADYVIIGAGAAAMAFADTLLSETEATIAMVDRRHGPGGHWNDAYPFVRLNSTSFFYGVNSAPLGQGRVDTVGTNRGLLELASGAEIVAYFDQVMRHRFLPSGRVTFLPSHEYASGVATSRLSGKAVALGARRKLVDATFAQTEIPATHLPGFAVAPGVICVAPNDLPGINQPGAEFVLVGGGKTSIDCALFLLDQGVDPDKITWIRPRDVWLLNRRQLQPRLDLAAKTIGAAVDDMEAAQDASSVENLFRRLEARKSLLRIDPGVAPTMYHCATVSELELQDLRRIRNVVRMGRVMALEPGRIVLEQGEVRTLPLSVHIHCAARGVPARGAEPIFQPGRIVLQFVNNCWPCFSAALIAWLESHRDDDTTRNRLAPPVPMVEVPLDWLAGKLRDGAADALWQDQPDLQAWKRSARVDGFAAMFAAVAEDPRPEIAALMQRLEAAYGPGMARLSELWQAATAD